MLAALLLGKAAQANERGVELDLTPTAGSTTGVLPLGLPARDLVTVLGNLLDNAVDAAAPPGQPPGLAATVTVTARAADGELLLRVADNGRAGRGRRRSEIFRRGWSTKAGHGGPARGRGLGLAPGPAGRCAATAGTVTLDRAPEAVRGSPYGCRCGRGRGHERCAACPPAREEAAVTATSGSWSSRTIRSPPTPTPCTSGGCPASPSPAPCTPAPTPAAIWTRTPSICCCSTSTCPTATGWQLVRTLRAAGHTADIIAVTSARDLTMVREGVSLGVVQYVLKPFTFATLRDRLIRYARFRATTGEASGQDEVDRALAGAARAPARPRCPRG